jgi:hypothetical protein
MKTIKQYFFPAIVLTALVSLTFCGVIFLISNAISEHSPEFSTGFFQGAGAAVGILGLLLFLNAVVGRLDS